MDRETLFTASKWDILQLLSKGSKSPIQLAKQANTSVANISQQLRLLEIAGIVKSVRVPNRDKDQPRILYSLKKEMAFVISIGDGFAEKGMLELDDRSSILLRIMLLKASLHYPMQKAFWHIEGYLDKIDAIIVEEAKGIMHIAADSTLKKHLETAKLDFITKEDAKRLMEKGQFVLYNKITKGEVA